MDNEQQAGQQADGYGDESLNTASASGGNQQMAEGQNSEHHSHKKGGIHSNALFAASMGRSATAHVHAHHSEGLAQTGTNISYEGATAPGGGGSSGSGFTSGQAGTGHTPLADSDYNQAAASGHSAKAGGSGDTTGSTAATDTEQS